MRVDRKLGYALALVGVLSLPSVANAQLQLFDRSANEGPGIKTGRLVLHPGLSLEGGYDTNVFLADQNEGGSFILRLTGYLDVATEPPQRQREGEANKPVQQKIVFRGGVGVRYYQYFDDRVDPNAAADAHINFAYNPSEVFTLEVQDMFLRTIRPFTNASTPDGPTTSYGRNINRASIDFVGRTKSQVLEGRLGYTNVFEFFDSDLFQYGNSITHRVPAQLSWSFFPNSALIYRVNYENQQYDETEVAASSTLLLDSNRVRTDFGYNGALTERLSMTALIGYTAGFYAFADDFDGLVARVDFRWQPRPTIEMLAGYDRNFRPSFIGNYYQSNRLFIESTFVVAGALRLGVDGWVSFDKSGLALAPDGTLLGDQPYREDIRVHAGIIGEYRFRSWLSLIGRVGYLADFTDFEYVGTQPLLEPAARYQRLDVWLGVRVFY